MNEVAVDRRRQGQGINVIYFLYQKRSRFSLLPTAVRFSRRCWFVIQPDKRGELLSVAEVFASEVGALLDTLWFF